MNPSPLGRPVNAALLLATFMLVPPAVTYLFPVSSFTPGAIVACLLGLVLVPLKWTSRVFATGAFKSGALVLGLALGIHFIVASFLVETDAIRFVGSAFIMLMIYAVASASSVSIYGAISKKGLHAIFFLMLAFVVLMKMGVVVPGPDITTKSVFPFSEPSFFGLAFLPLLLWCAASAKKQYRFLFVIVGVATALVLQNLTMLAGTLLVLVAISSARGIVVMAALLVGALLVSGFDLSYYAERLNFSGENNNVSTLAFIQGWQLIDESMSKSSGWGVGFSQMGINGSEVEAAELIYLIVGTYTNLNDGTFIFSRLASDFGVFGVALTLYYLWVVRRSFVAIRRYSLGRLELLSGEALAHAVILMSVIDVFVRGIGYLTGSMIVFVSACQFLYGPFARSWMARAVGRRIAV